MTSFDEPTELLRLGIETRSENGLVTITLRGEADFATVERLEATLEQVELAGDRAVHVDLTELDFADVAILRQLMLFAQRARGRGHQVTTGGARPVLRKIAGLLGGEDTLGLA
jgi:anti-anti-sigma regulatory factor